MVSARSSQLIEKLERGLSKSLAIFQSLEPDQWKRPIFEGLDPWDMKDLLAHFIYSEEHLRMIAQDIAAGGEGAPLDLDIDRYNQDELARLRPVPVDDLLRNLVNARQATILWVQGLDEATLDRVGRHPVLGATKVETVIHSIYAHQLLHMREVQPMLKKS